MPPSAALRAAADRVRAQAKALRVCEKDVAGMVKGHWFEGPGGAGIYGEVRGAVGEVVHNVSAGSVVKVLTITVDVMSMLRLLTTSNQ